MDNTRQAIGILIAAIVVMSVFAFAVTPTSAWDPYTGPKEPTSSSSHHTTVADPIGDTFGSFTVQHDITRFSAYYTPTELIITVRFAGTISPGDSGQPDAVVGYIDLDTDQNPSTGISSWVDYFTPYTTGLGVDYWVYLTSYNSLAGAAPVYDRNGTFVGTAPVRFTAQFFTVKVPLAVIGGDDGVVDTATILGSVPEPTDVAPNGGFIPSSPWPQAPALTPIGLIALVSLLATIAALNVRRKRH